MVTTADAVLNAALPFAEILSNINQPATFKLDSRSLGNYVQQQFDDYLSQRFTMVRGNKSSGVDLPSVNLDIKTTRVTRPQSSSSHNSVRQKVFGLEHGLLIFAYEILVDVTTHTKKIAIQRIVYVAAEQTAHHSTTKNIQEIIATDGTVEDISSYLMSSDMRVQEDEAQEIAEEIMSTGTIKIGYLGMTRALQWRMTYNLALSVAGTVEGVKSLL